jgi:hypothetical protein
MPKPEKNLENAIARLTAGKAYLICRGDHRYGGSIEADLLAVLEHVEYCTNFVNMIKAAAPEVYNAGVQRYNESTKS